MNNDIELTLKELAKIISVGKTEIDKHLVTLILEKLYVRGEISGMKEAHNSIKRTY